MTKCVGLVTDFDGGRIVEFIMVDLSINNINVKLLNSCEFSSKNIIPYEW